MTKKAVFFNDAFKAVYNLICKEKFPEGVMPIVIRDVYGRIRIALKNGDKEKHQELAARLEQEMSKIAPFYGNQGKGGSFSR